MSFVIRKKSDFFTKISRIVLLIFLLLIIISSVFCWSRFLVKKEKYNLILISVDTLNVGHMSLYGYNKKTTPFLDIWSKDALVFDNVYTTIPSTYPSFSSLFTGLHPLTSRIVSNVISPWISTNTPTLALILKENNYATKAFVTNRFIGPELTNLRDGFDEFNFFDSYGFWKEPSRREKYNEFIENSLDKIKSDSPKNQFYWFHLMDPHYPYFPPDQYKCSFSSFNCSNIKNKSISDLFGEEKNRMEGCNIKGLTEEKINSYSALYDGDIASADEIVSRIIKKIRSSGLDENSIIIFYSDHGEGFDHNYHFAHGEALYNSSSRIPLVIRFPKKPVKKGRNSTLIANIDILNTILDLLNISKKNTASEGKSFANIFKFNMFDLLSGYYPRKSLILMNNNANKFALIKDGYKYIYSQQNSCLYKGFREELYNLQNDFKEEVNLISQNSRQKKKLREILMNSISLYNYPQESINYYSQNTPKDVIDKLRELGY